MLSFYKFAKWVVCRLSPNQRARMSEWFGPLLCFFNPRRKMIIQANLTPLVGEKRASELAPVLFSNFFMTAADFFCRPPAVTREAVIENWSIFENAYEENPRVMFVTAHWGSWELGLSLLAERGYAVTGVYAEYREDHIVRWIQSHRHSSVQWLAAGRGTAQACLQALDQGRVVGMVADIPFEEEGRKVQIAGHSARLPLGPWAIAERAKATVIPAFIGRESPGRYRAVIYPALRPDPQASFRTNIRSMQEAFRLHLEQHLLKTPEQWGVLQPFWETCA